MKKLLMKRSSKAILIILILSLTLILLFVRNSRIARTSDELIDIVSERLDLEQDDAMTVAYAGEFLQGTDALFWFIIQGDSSAYYRAVECKELSDNGYLFKEIYMPSTYSKDIVHLIWKAEDVYLINDTNCRSIITKNQSGEILSQISISPEEYPFIFHLDPPIGSTTTSFLDSQGNEIS